MRTAAESRRAVENVRKRKNPRTIAGPGIPIFIHGYLNAHPAHLRGGSVQCYRQVFWLSRSSGGLPIAHATVAHWAERVPSNFEGGITAAGPHPVHTGFPFVSVFGEPVIVAGMVLHRWKSSMKISTRKHVIIACFASISDNHGISRRTADIPSPERRGRFPTGCCNAEHGQDVQKMLGPGGGQSAPNVTSPRPHAPCASK